MSGNDKKLVLDVGQCQPDHTSISKLIESKFDARVEYCADIGSAMTRLRERKFDLVLVNRIIDATLDEGIGLVRQMKDSEFLREVPVMLVSNFDSAHREATALGAVEGFGKADIEEEQTRRLLARYLT